MKSLLLIISLLMVSACSNTKTKPEEPYIEHSLVAKKIPSELLEMPAPVAAPNLDGTQKDIGLWIIESEKRTRTLENQIKKIKEYNDGK